MDGAKDPDMIRNHHELNDLVHKMDPTRPTVIACISMCGMDEEYVHIPDVVSYNHYFGWYGGSMEEYGPWFDKFHAKYPNTPIGVSEYGCEALNWHNSNPESGDYSEEYQAMYHESLIRQLFSRKYIWATHVWNMFDFGADARAEGGENGQNAESGIFFDPSGRTLSISGSALPAYGSTIVVEARGISSASSYNIQNHTENIAVDSYAADGGLNICLTPYGGYQLPDTISLSIDGSACTVYTNGQGNPDGIGFDGYANLLYISGYLLSPGSTVVVSASAVSS